MGNMHPEMVKFASLFEQMIGLSGYPYLRDDNYKTVRDLFEKLQMPDPNLPKIGRKEDRELEAPGRQIPIRIYWPDVEGNRPVLVWMHGGGWVFGDLNSADRNCHHFCNDLGCVVVSVDYRLAPETPFPGAVNDAYFATKWVAANATELGIDPSRIAIGGDSSGANLAAGVALRSRDSGPSLCHQLLIYPVLAADFETLSYLAHGEDKLLTTRNMRWYWDKYVPDDSQRTNPLVAPINADDLADLPPAHIITAEFDPLRDEAESYGQALENDGVPAEIFRYAGMIHNFYNYVSAEPIPAVEQARENAHRALRRAFA